jgi:adenylate kinase family enzyme
MQARRAACTAVKVMIAGAPGSGKGTQCLRIVEKVWCRWTAIDR